MSTTPATEYAAAIDTELAQVQLARHKAEAERTRIDYRLRGVAGGTVKSEGRFGRRVDVWDITHSDARDRCAELAATVADDNDYRPAEAQRVLAELDAVETKLDGFINRINELEYEHLCHGWSRFFHVTNSNGHIHSSTHCTTCYDSTEYAWVTGLSGQSEADAVAELGEILCSVCFPSAPVEWTTGESKATKEAREVREAKKAARAFDKRQKALIPEDPEGGYRPGGSRADRVTTVYAAKQWLTSYYEWKGYGGDPDYTHPCYPTADAEAIAALLVGRPKVKETTAEAVLAAAKKRAAK